MSVGLVDLVCSTLAEEDVFTCAEGIYDWWPSITVALFNYEGTADRICVGPCSCKGSSSGIKSIFKQVSLFHGVLGY